MLITRLSPAVALALLAAGATALPAAADHDKRRGGYDDRNSGYERHDGYDQGYSNRARQYARRGGDGLVLFQHPGFKGRSVEIRGPVYSLSRERIGLNDEVSSIAVLGGTWEVCADPSFTGRCRIIRGDEVKLSYIRMDDNITSIRPVGRQHDYGDAYGRERRPVAGRHDRGARSGVRLFEHPDFRGRSLPVSGAVPYLKPLGANDTVSSIAIHSGAWLVCSDPDYRGRCEIIDASVRTLTPYRLNDNISSIRPVDPYARSHSRYTYK